LSVRDHSEVWHHAVVRDVAQAGRKVWVQYCWPLVGYGMKRASDVAAYHPSEGLLLAPSASAHVETQFEFRRAREDGGPKEGWREEGHPWIGRAVARAFGGVAVAAMVKRWQPEGADPVEECALWHVEYVDGDEEDLNEKEMVEAMALYATSPELEKHRCGQKRKAEGEASCVDMETVPTSLTIGNTHRYDYKKNKHEWTLFVRGVDGKDEGSADLGIESVTFHIHRSYSPSRFVVSKPPFMISNTGCTTFEATVEVLTKGGSVSTHKWMLSFKKSLSFQKVKHADRESDSDSDLTDVTESDEEESDGDTGGKASGEEPSVGQQNAS